MIEMQERCAKFFLWSFHVLESDEIAVLDPGLKNFVPVNIPAKAQLFRSVNVISVIKFRKFFPNVKFHEVRRRHRAESVECMCCIHCTSGVTRGRGRTAPGDTRPKIIFLWLNLENTG